MTAIFETRMLVSELRSLTRCDALRGDDEAADARARVAEICRTLGVEYAEDAIEMDNARIVAEMDRHDRHRDRPMGY